MENDFVKKFAPVTEKATILKEAYQAWKTELENKI